MSFLEQGVLPADFTFICRRCRKPLSTLASGLQFAVKSRNRVLGFFDPLSQYIAVHVPFIDVAGYPGVIFCEAHCPNPMCDAVLGRSSIPRHRNYRAEDVVAAFTQFAKSQRPHTLFRLLLVLDEFQIIPMNITPTGEIDNQLG